MITIGYPTTEQDIEDVRMLFRGFVDWARTRYEAHLVDLYFNNDAFDSELRALPGPYARPEGNLLLASEDGRPVGCVGYRRVDAEACEMKRMYVSMTRQRAGIGRALAVRLIADAKAVGYKQMRLDTGVKQFEAQALYRSLGFREIPPPFEIPEEFRGQIIFMVLDLI